ncbi:expressed unknown protein [Seminavis robusta]|uniref:Sec20 C-terminal domain-containing protein n=1 Tax=Seminavis robusta TaxID=568900 RepID=A0A9N8HF82_9STRA|nr:expressed unknown protein [Seminavis robusta]|eukprot:Sro443_g144160.1 n/a (185) ;mRNA; f:55015-55569
MATASYQSPSTHHGRSRGASTIREDRKVLFQDSASGNNRRKKTGSSSTASEAQSIQQSLQRTQNLLKNELDRVSQVVDVIDQDGKLLEETKDEYQSMDVSGAANALNSLKQAQQQEQRVLMASVLFFFSVVFYIMWERVLIKLPFVERIVKMVLSSLHQFLGELMSQIQPMMALAREKVGELIG